MRYRDWDSYYFPRSRPLGTRGGIKSQSQRGEFGRSWWARRWISVLESFHIGARLQRGRSYARSGQTLSVDIDKGIVKAKVQGSRPRPYDVTIRVRTLKNEKWKKLSRALSKQALHAAKLMAGEMPQDIEKVFDSAGISLFPQTSKDLETDCSCPDWSNPCKHIAAVYYLLGEEFDRDPFLIFKLRGRSREELVGSLEHSTKQGISQSSTADASCVAHALPVEAFSFWRMQSLPEDPCGEVECPAVSAALPRQLGNFPFWRGAEPCTTMLEPLYSRSSVRGLEIVLERGRSSKGAGTED